MMKKILPVLAILLVALFVLTACGPAAQEEAPAAEAENQPKPDAPADDNAASEPADEAGEEIADAPPEVSIDIAPEDFSWDLDYITEVPPIMMYDPYFEIFGQTNGPVPYTYETAVKLAGHSCGATAGAWVITQKALEVLYPNGETPVRGSIFVEAPGAQEEFPVGVFGEVITYITGASPEHGFIGAEFGKTDPMLFNRQNKMVYMDEPSGTPPPKMEWVFTRLDNGAKVGVTFNLAVILPVSTDAEKEMGKKMAAFTATPEEAAGYYQYWNDRATFVFDNADSLDGFLFVNVYQAPPVTTGAADPAPVAASPADFSWTQDYITEQDPIMMYDPYFSIFGQSQTAIPYYYEEAVQLAGHSCGATTGAWTIAKKALEVLYPDGEIPVRGQIAVEAPGSESEFPVGVFGEVITFITGASPHTGFIGQEFGQTDQVFVRQNKMVYMDEPSGTPPPMMEWIFTRLDTGAKVGVKFNLMIITPIPHPGRVKMGETMAAFEATPEEAADYIQYWNDRAIFVFEHEDLNGFFTVKVYE